MPQEDFREVKVVHGDDEWMVEVDPDAPVLDLLPELLEALSLVGNVDDFELETQGTISKPIIVLRPKARRSVGRARKVV